MNISNNIDKNLNSYAIVYPDKIKEFLNKQESLFKDKENLECAFAGKIIYK